MPLSSFRISRRPNGTKSLLGSLELPLPVGTKGGALHAHPGYQNSLKMLGDVNSEHLSYILVSIGLANNFAALRALSVTGIQAGHMALHARNISLAVGAREEHIDEMCNHMQEMQTFNRDIA